MKLPLERCELSPDEVFKALAADLEILRRVAV